MSKDYQGKPIKRCESPARFKQIECNPQFRYVVGYRDEPCDGCQICDHRGHHEVTITQSVFDIEGYAIHSWNFFPDDDERILVVLEKINEPNTI